MTATLGVLTLHDFLLARIEEALADIRRVSERGGWTAPLYGTVAEQSVIRRKGTRDVVGQMSSAGSARHVVNWQPARVELDLIGKRALVERHIELLTRPDEKGRPAYYTNPVLHMQVRLSQTVLAHLSVAWSDHIDYQRGWMPW